MTIIHSILQPYKKQKGRKSYIHLWVDNVFEFFSPTVSLFWTAYTIFIHLFINFIIQSSGAIVMVTWSTWLNSTTSQL